MWTNEAIWGCLTVLMCGTMAWPEDLESLARSDMTKFLSLARKNNYSFGSNEVEITQYSPCDNSLKYKVRIDWAGCSTSVTSEYYAHWVMLLQMGLYSNFNHFCYFWWDYSISVFEIPHLFLKQLLRLSSAPFEINSKTSTNFSGAGLHLVPFGAFSFSSNTERPCKQV